MVWFFYASFSVSFFVVVVFFPIFLLCRFGFFLFVVVVFSLFGLNSVAQFSDGKRYCFIYTPFPQQFRVVGKLFWLFYSHPSSPRPFLACVFFLHLFFWIGGSGHKPMMKNFKPISDHVHISVHYCHSDGEVCCNWKTNVNTAATIYKDYKANCSWYIRATPRQNLTLLHGV